MNKLVCLFVLIGAVCIAEDKVFSLASASGSLTQSITNTTTDQRWYLKSLFAVSGATNDTVTLYKVSNSVNIPVGTDIIGAVTDASIAVVSDVYLSPGEVMVIGRTITNTTLKGFVVVGGE